MRKVRSFMVTTLDGFVEGPNQEFDWPNVDAEFNEFAAKQLEEADTLLFGRLTYEGMAGYWPTADARRDDPVVAPLMNNIAKIVFSATLDKAEWNNSTLVRGNAADEVKRLKEQPGKDMFIFGSPNLTVSLLRAGLVDEVGVMVNPILLGAGRSLFDASHDRIHLKHVRTRTFDSGNVLLTYEPLIPGVTA
jgi:dihydrofolate reductase